MKNPSLYARTRRLVIVATATIAVISVAGDPVTATGEPPIADTDVRLAIDGLDQFVAEHRGSGPGPLAVPCPILDPLELASTMDREGRPSTSVQSQVLLFRDSTLGDDFVGVQCGPDLDEVRANPDPVSPYAGVMQAVAMPDRLTFADVVASFGGEILDPGVPDGGEVAAACRTGDPAFCLAFWHRDGLLLMFGLLGPDVIDVDAVRLLAVARGPAVATLSGSAGPSTEATSTTAASTGSTNPGKRTGIDTAGARAGLGRYFADVPIGGEAAACPLGDRDLLAASMTEHGLAPAADQFVTSTIGLDPVDPDTPQLFCMMAPVDRIPRGSLFAFDITGVTSFEEVVIEGNAGRMIDDDVPGIGGQVGGNCYDFEGRFACWIMWHRDGLVIDLYITGQPGTFDETALQAMLVELVPTLITNLAAYPAV